MRVSRHDLHRADLRHPACAQPWRGAEGRASRPGITAISTARSRRPCSRKPAVSPQTCSRRSTRSATSTASRSTDGMVTTRAGLARRLSPLVGGGLERGAGSGGMRRPGPAARDQLRLHRNVERRQHRVRAVPAADAQGASRRSMPMASDELKKTYLAKLVSGEWTGTMQLTEPRRRLRRRRAAHPRRARGRRQLSPVGQQDLHHLRRTRHDRQHRAFRARTPARCAGRHARHFAVPGAEVPRQCRRLARQAQRHQGRAGVEHKLGIHASPTCTMSMGDDGGAIGFLIGEENRGMACMFTMMNQARLGVGLEGVGIADRAYQQALAFAQERKQGRGVGKGRRARSDHRASRRQAHAAADARPDRRGARDLLRHRGRDRRVACAPMTPRCARCGRRARRAADADRKGVLHRHRQRGRLSGRAGAWRHGLHRGDRRRAAHARCAHHRDLRRHQRHPVDRSRRRASSRPMAARRCSR